MRALRGWIALRIARLAMALVRVGVWVAPTPIVLPESDEFDRYEEWKATQEAGR